MYILNEIQIKVQSLLSFLSNLKVICRAGYKEPSSNEIVTKSDFCGHPKLDILFLCKAKIKLDKEKVHPQL